MLPFYDLDKCYVLYVLDNTNANNSKHLKRREDTNDEERESVPSTSFEKKVHFQESKEDTSYLSETESSWLEVS